MGATCHYCEGFLDWLETVDDDVKSKFNLVKLEVWKNAVNNSAMKKVADIFDDDSGSVPYIVIGDFSFVGFSESRDAQTIINAINDEYAKDTRNDVIKDNAEGIIRCRQDGVYFVFCEDKIYNINPDSPFACALLGNCNCNL